MSVLFLEIVMPKNPKYWYQADFVEYCGDAGNVATFMDILANSFADAEELAMQCMEPSQEIKNIFRKGTYAEYQEEKGEVDEISPWGLYDVAELKEQITEMDKRGDEKDTWP